MKLNLAIILFLIFNIALLAQEKRQHRERENRKGRELFEQVEKFKLIETLNMDEETAIKFFARRNSIMSQHKETIDKRDSLILFIDDYLISDKKNISEKESKKIIDELLNYENKIFNDRSNFMNSLDDILTPEQQLQFIVFEFKFKKHIKNIFFDKEGPPKRKN